MLSAQAADINITNVTKAAIVKGADELLMVVDGTKSRLVPVSKALDLLQFPSNSPPIVYTTNLYATYVTNQNLYVSNAYITNLIVTNAYAEYFTNTFMYVTYETNTYLYSTNIYNSYLTNNYAYITNLYVTNLYSLNADSRFITNWYLYCTNAIIENLTATNVTFYGDDTTILSNLMVTGSITNDSLTGSQFVATDANKKLVSTLNGNTLTNLVLSMTTNAITALELSAFKSYYTNIAGNMALTAFAGVPNNLTWAIYLYVTNSSANDYTVTGPNGTISQGYGTPPVFYITNKQSAAIQVTGYGQMATNMFWYPFY